MRTWLFLLTCLFVGVVAALLYQAYRPEDPLPERAAEKIVPAPSITPKPPAPVLHPVSEAPVAIDSGTARLGLEAPLPPLDESDGRIARVLEALVPDHEPENLLVPNNFIQRFVVMVDNLPRDRLPVNHLPVRPTQGAFLVRETAQGPVVDPANYRRYRPFLAFAEALDPELVVATYVRFYPLFQQAYQQLGYPSGYFNDRLVEVIDHLLATPVVTDPIRLVRPKIRYHFADPALEGLSAGRKLILRTGPENAARIRQLLRTYQSLLARSQSTG